MTPIYDRSAMKPIGSDAEYLEAEFAWIKARCLHLGARLDAERDARDAEPALVFADEPEAAWPDETRAKAKRLEAAEAAIRDRLDARLEATRKAGVILGLDRLVERHDLDHIDRQVLLLATMPAVGLELFDVLGSVASFGFALMSISPQLISTFCGLDLAGQVGLRERLGPNGKLVSAGLVEVDLPGRERCQDFPTASIFIEQGAFDVIVGAASAEDEGPCPCCGQVAAGKAGAAG